MGLDMFLRGEKYFWTDWNEPKNNVTEDGFKIKTKELELGYWRKHPDLHGYIVQTFANGEDNCERIDLSTDDIKKIIQAIKDKKLPKTSGFFFGASDGSEDEDSIKILQKALEWESTEEKGVSRTVYYKASW